MRPHTVLPWPRNLRQDCSHSERVGTNDPRDIKKMQPLGACGNQRSTRYHENAATRSVSEPTIHEISPKSKAQERKSLQPSNFLAWSLTIAGFIELLTASPGVALVHRLVLVATVRVEVGSEEKGRCVYDGIAEEPQAAGCPETR